MRAQVSYPGFARSLQLLIFIGIPRNQISAVTGILFKTYPFYNDRKSRRAVQECLQTLLTNTFYSTDIHNLISAFKSEASKFGLAPSNAFVLVEWGSILLQHCGDNIAVWEEHGSDLVKSDAQVLDLCLSTGTRSNVQLSALGLTRRALRRLFNNNERGEEIVGTIVSQLTSNSNSLGLRSAVFLGVVAGVCARLPSKRAILESTTGHFYSYYVREVVGSRSIVPPHRVVAFNDFFSNFATLTDLQANVIPALEKALLRAPEVVLNHLVSSLVISLSPKIDLAQTISDHLLKPLLSNIKSQNPVICNGALTAFAVLINRCYDDSYVKKITDDILLPVSTSKVPVAEQRAFHAKMLSCIPFLSSRSKLICDGLLPTLSKEPNELALTAEALAFTQHFSSLLAAGSESLSISCDSIIEAYVKGLGDKRPALRRIWVMKAGDVLWQLKILPNESQIAAQFIDFVMPKLLELFDELTTSPQQTTQSMLTVAVYIVVAISSFVLEKAHSEKLRSLIKKMKVYDRVLLSSSKQSVLLNHRVYSKISVKEEISWMTRALEACSNYLPGVIPASAVNIAWAHAFIYLIAAADVSAEIQKESQNALRNSYIKNPLTIADSIIHGLWAWHRNLASMEKDTAVALAKTGGTKLHLIVHSICIPNTKAISSVPNIEEHIIQNQLVDMLVLCRPEILPRVAWIEICLRMGQDPGVLVKSKAIRCLEKVDSFLSINDPDSALASVELAAYNTAADLAFVAPNTITPLLVSKIRNDLSADALYSYGPTEIAISRASEETPFVDVLNKKARNFVVDKNSPDYDTMKWEDEVRAQVAKKRGQEKKLTPDEKAKVNAQLSKEATIRKEVKFLERRLKRGIGFINALITGPPTESHMWMSRSLKSLLDVIIAGAGRIVGDAANAVYIACASVVSPRLGPLRQFIGIATLRSIGFSDLPDHLKQEPLGGWCAIPSGNSLLC